MGEKEEISRSEASRLLGVSVSVVKGYPIPFRQYCERGKAIYSRSDVLAFKEQKSHNITSNAA
jgi:hypothetical protein